MMLSGIDAIVSCSYTRNLELLELAHHFVLFETTWHACTRLSIVHSVALMALIVPLILTRQKVDILSRGLLRKIMLSISVLMDIVYTFLSDHW